MNDDLQKTGPATTGVPGAMDPRHTVACLFETRAGADRAADALVADGFDRSAMTIVDQAGATDARPESGGMWESIKRLFTGEEGASYYEGVRRGESLLTVAVRDHAETDRVAAILERHDPIDLDTQEGSWREEGWTGGPTPVDVPARPPQPVPAAQPTQPTPSGDEQVIPVVEEKLAVGKRPAGGNRVRVHSRVVETPVEEDVRLREERVQVERRPVDRPAAAGEGAFQERSVEMTETREEPVVGKTARVTEEVAVRKEAGERTRRVSDKLRRTEVKVDKDGAAAPSERPAAPPQP